MNESDFRRIDSQAREKFTPRDDPPNFDQWISHIGEVLANKPWTGDCSHLVPTVMDLLYNAELRLERGFRILLNTVGHATKPNHMVGCAQADDGSFWIVGDRNSKCYPAEMFSRHWQVFQHHRLNEWHNGEPVWREGLPFTK